MPDKTPTASNPAHPVTRDIVLSPSHRWRAYWVAVAVAALTILDLTKVNVALPSIEAALGAGPTELQLVVSGYILTFGHVLVPAGRLGDLRSRRVLFLVGLSLFLVTSLACALAPNTAVLLAARLLPVAPQPLELRLPTTIDGLHVVRDALRTWTRGAPLSRPESEGLVLAAWEATANAIEHAGGHADLMVVRAMLEDSTIRVTVEDNGAGIPEDLQPHLFDPFVTTKVGGKGLGLALVAKIVGDHGGVIEFTSEPRRTVFTVMLPAAASLAEDEQ